MRNKRRWYPILLVGLILIVATSVMACGQPAPATPTTPTTKSAPVVTEEKTTPLPTGAIAWNEAKYHIGEKTTVYGPVVDTRWASGSKGQPTFLNIGKPYPDPNRFTVVIWIQNRAKFSPAPEIQYKGRTIYVSGLIDEYPKGSGSAQIIVTSPSQIQVK